jgi:hypothetical protein
MPDPIEVEPRPLRPGANLPAVRNAPRRRVSLGWVALVVLLAVILGGGYFGQDRIVALWPNSARVYEMVGLSESYPGEGLQLRNVSTKRKTLNGISVIVIEGEVANISAAARDVPAIRASVRGAAETELYHWIFFARTERLEPGESAPFSTQFDRSLEGATGFAITFTNQPVIDG